MQYRSFVYPSFSSSTKIPQVLIIQTTDVDTIGTVKNHLKSSLSVVKIITIYFNTKVLLMNQSCHICLISLTFQATTPIYGSNQKNSNIFFLIA